MASVTHRIRSIKQPYGGYLKRKDFHIVNFDDGIILHSNENIPPTTVGMTVDYLTRFMYVKHNRKAAFDISLKGGLSSEGQAWFLRGIPYKIARTKW